MMFNFIAISTVHARVRMVMSGLVDSDQSVVVDFNE